LNATLQRKSFVHILIDVGASSMSYLWRGFFVPLITALVCGCAQVPQMPPDYMLPVREIVLNAACELRSSLQHISQTNPEFLSHPWAISISVTPKIDSELSLRVGNTGKSTTLTKRYFNTWILGNAPGAEYDMKGHTDGSAAYNVKSDQLIDEQKYPLTCDRASPTYNALAAQLGIYDWLNRTAAAAEGSIAGLTKIDKPTYNSEIIVTWDGAGSFTYNYPLGTDFFGFMGSYKIDESVAVAFTAEPKPTRKIRTLPNGTEYSSVDTGPGSVSPAAQSRLDLLSLQQSITNLENAVNRRR
jgi:hypothetical protein